MIKLQRGFMALVTVVIIAAAALVMSLNSSFLGFGTLDMSFLTSEGGRATALTEACAETALVELRVNPSYTGIASPGLSLFGGSCIIEVTNLGGNNRQATTTATLGNFTKRVALTVTLDLNTRSLTVNSWQEI